MAFIKLPNIVAALDHCNITARPTLTSFEEMDVSDTDNSDVSDDDRETEPDI